MYIFTVIAANNPITADQEIINILEVINLGFINAEM